MLHDDCKATDSSRPSTMGMNNYINTYTFNFVQQVDIAGVNYKPTKYSEIRACFLNCHCMVQKHQVVQTPNDDIKIAYANTTFFDTEDSFDLKNIPNYKTLRDSINAHMPTKNIFYAFKIHGNFKKMKCGGLHKQEPPYETGLYVLIPNRPVFERENFSGTMVGFFCPEYIGNINVAAYHLHFVSDDKTFAGHVMEFEATDLTVEVDYIYEYTFALPQTDAYLKGNFEKEFQYKKK